MSCARAAPRGDLRVHSEESGAQGHRRCRSAWLRPGAHPANLGPSPSTSGRQKACFTGLLKSPRPPVTRAVQPLVTDCPQGYRRTPPSSVHTVPARCPPLFLANANQSPPDGFGLQLSCLLPAPHVPLGTVTSLGISRGHREQLKPGPRCGAADHLAPTRGENAHCPEPVTLCACPHT